MRLPSGGQVVLVVGHLDVGEQLASLADEVQTPAQQIPGRAHARRVDVGLGQHPAAQQHGDLERVDPVVLGLAAVDRLHVERVAEHEGDALAAQRSASQYQVKMHSTATTRSSRYGRDDLEERLGRSSAGSCGRGPGRRVSRMQTYMVLACRSMPHQ